jgi:hypothetical protein
MWTRRSFIGLLTTATFTPVVANSAATSPPGTASAAPSRRNEIDALRQFAEATHPRGCSAATDANWRSRWDTLARDADALTDGEYLMRTRRALGWFGDGHTTVLPFEFIGGVPPQLAGGPFRLHLPLKLRAWHDGVWVIGAAADAKSLLGGKLESIGKLSVSQLIRNHATEWPGNDAWAQRWAAAALSSPALLQALRAIDDPTAPIPMTSLAERGRTSVQLKVVSDDGENPNLTAVERSTTEHEGWAKSAGVGNYLRRLDTGVTYLSLDEMDDVEGKTFEALTREVFAELDRADLRRLIVDLRRNGGGNNYLGEALRKGIARSRINKPGGLYALISPQTFSAAQNLANRLERETFTTFVGEPTGGAPNHCGDAKVFAGPVTGLTSIVSSLPWFDSYPQDRRPWIFPDLPVPETFIDWKSGRDAALSAAIEHDAPVAVDELSPERIYYFRRDSQSQDWRPFWRG